MIEELSQAEIAAAIRLDKSEASRIKYCECCEQFTVGDLDGYDDLTPIYTCGECGEMLI